MSGCPWRGRVSESSELRDPPWPRKRAASAGPRSMASSCDSFFRSYTCQPASSSRALRAHPPHG
eukprot:3353984-Pyramimonas_sp.AAC.1